MHQRMTKKKHTNKAKGSPLTDEQIKALAQAKLEAFPIAVEKAENELPTYGTNVLTFPIDEMGNTVAIDASMFRGSKTARLRHYKQALKIAGRDADKPENVEWFDKEVRDKWHKVLRHAAKLAMRDATPVSLGVSIRTEKKTKNRVLTSTHGFERILPSPESAKAIADAKDKAEADKASKQSKNRARKQARRAKRNVGLVKLSEILPPSLTPANGNGSTADKASEPTAAK